MNFFQFAAKYSPDSTLSTLPNKRDLKYTLHNKYTQRMSSSLTFTNPSISVESSITNAFVRTVGVGTISIYVTTVSSLRAFVNIQKTKCLRSLTLLRSILVNHPSKYLHTNVLNVSTKQSQLATQFLFSNIQSQNCININHVRR